MPKTFRGRIKADDPKLKDLELEEGGLIPIPLILVTYLPSPNRVGCSRSGRPLRL